MVHTPNLRASFRPQQSHDGRVKAVLGPTNTGKTHLAIERLCAHSSGAIGFPLRLLAREVYEKVCAIKGAEHVALITGEERIEPPNARWLLCTVEAMPVRGPVRGGPKKGANTRFTDLSFVAIDEIQLCGDRDRGHIFTDRLLHARGRDETMLLGSSVMEPLVKSLVPEAEIVSRPRFSTLSHSGAKKLSRVPPRSAIVAFSAEQVYAVAEMLRRFRGGAAVVMGALSPETRNRQVELYQSGEVDYLVATDAIGMGLNLDITHVAFAGLSKYDGVRQRRLLPTEMAQIAGRAGRHQRDGTFGTLAGTGGHDAEFSDEEIYAIEEHRFAPLTRLFWRESDLSFDSVARLIGSLERPPAKAELIAAPQAIDLAVLKRLAEDPDIAPGVRGTGMVRRFWEACSLPDFRQQGAETHARFVARLWEELRHGPLGADTAPRAIAQLDNTQGDIDTLQGRIAAVRSWSYICQRPDWVLARDEMAARAREVESRLSDALHARLTERFVNRRTTVLMRKLGPDAGLLSVAMEGDDVLVEGEKIGTLSGFAFRVDPSARHEDARLLQAAAEKHLPDLLARRAGELIAALNAGEADVEMQGESIVWHGHPLARIARGRALLTPTLTAVPLLDRLAAPLRADLIAALGQWLARRWKPLAPLAAMEAASLDPDSGSDLRALLIRMIEGGGMVDRAASGVEKLSPPQRDVLRRLGVRIGPLDVFHPAMVKAAPLQLWQSAVGAKGIIAQPMTPVVKLSDKPVPRFYRRLGQEALRIDRADRLLREAHARRKAASGKGGKTAFSLDPGEAVKIGLSTRAYAHLLRLGGFRPIMPRVLPPEIHGPPAPLVWRWHPPRRETEASTRQQAAMDVDSPFAALASLVA
ncbi:helicase-related protein [Novosphingobium sp. SG707]|uniref:helicase-related protein n=1 Tax=Novosphingobium sp. SG707 TaxID=2586996 RepID=UPI0014488C50|nr:helicase-related protein [Novosphingobium sp. SG707]NKJ00076.1 ATP-dependent RNA helicase SUPV3L1/SUV3 [Novosphingobium sp. SG707]